MNNNLPSFFELVAGKIKSRPELIGTARENCARWLAENHSAPERLREWDKLLAAAEDSAAGWDRLQSILLSQDPAIMRLREFHPFAGVLTREERRQARELCGYRH